MSGNPEILHTLKTARELIAVPERWCQVACALDGNGDPVGPKSEAAACYCLDTAVYRAAPYDAYQAAVAYLSDLTEDGDHIDFNDDPATTHADVIALCDWAIAKLEAAP